MSSTRVVPIDPLGLVFQFFPAMDVWEILVHLVFFREHGQCVCLLQITPRMHEVDRHNIQLEGQGMLSNLIIDRQTTLISTLYL